MNEDRERDFIERQTNPDISRRHMLKWLRNAGYGVAASSFLASCAIPAGGIGAKQLGSDDGGFGAGSDTIKIGVIAPFSGVGAFLGAIVQRSLDAAVLQINSEGGMGGRKVEWIPKDISATDPQQVLNAYQDLAGQDDTAGIVWAVPGGIIELQDRIGVDRIFVSAAFADLHDSGNLYPDNEALRPVFQFLTPNSWAVSTLADYCKNDRGFDRAGLIYDNTLGDGAKYDFDAAMADIGMSVTGTAGYQLNNSNFGPQISAVGRPQTLWMWGLATDTANAVKQIGDAGRDYISINEAKTGARPQLMGSPAALGEKKWAELAGDTAKAGTLTAWHVGGLIYLPTFAMREYMQKHTGVDPTGGEETPADALYLIANSVNEAGSLDRDAMIAAAENAGRQKFASVDFEFGPDNHLARHPDDIIVVTLERAGKPADPGYTLGREWTEVFPSGYVGPTHLVRPTVEANMRRHPEVMQLVIEQGWGTDAPPGNITH